jgi:hypothetical protein
MEAPRKAKRSQPTVETIEDNSDSDSSESSLSHYAEEDSAEITPMDGNIFAFFFFRALVSALQKGTRSARVISGPTPIICFHPIKGNLYPKHEKPGCDFENSITFC